MKRLTVKRQALGWTRARLAREAGLNQATVGQIEAGRLLPYPSQLQKLAAALGIDAPSELLREVEDAIDAEQQASGLPQGSAA